MKSKSGRLKEANQSGGRVLKAEALRRKGARGPTAKMKPPLAPRGVRAFLKPAANEGPPRAALRQDKFFDIEALAVEREDRLPRLSI